MLETASLARAAALAQRPAPSNHQPHVRRAPGAFRTLRIQWRRLRRVLVKPGRAVPVEAIPRLS